MCRVAEWRGCVDDAVARGELPDGTDPGALLRAVAAPLYHRLLTRNEAPEPADARRAATVAAVAARAGAFVDAQAAVSSAPG